MGYADIGRARVIIGCRCPQAFEPNPARFSTGSRRGHFDVVTSLVGGASDIFSGRFAHAGRRANLVGGVGDSIASALSDAKGIVGAMSTPMKLGLAGMALAGVLIARGDFGK